MTIGFWLIQGGTWFCIGGEKEEGAVFIGDDFWLIAFLVLS